MERQSDGADRKQSADSSASLRSWVRMTSMCIVAVSGNFPVDREDALGCEGRDCSSGVVRQKLFAGS